MRRCYDGPNVSRDLPGSAREPDHFILKGHLKNVQVAYMRAAAMLTMVRDEKIFLALKHETIDDYAEKRLELDLFLDHLKAATGAVARASRFANAGKARFSANRGKVHARRLHRSARRDLFSAARAPAIVPRRANPSAP